MTTGLNEAEGEARELAGTRRAFLANAGAAALLSLPLLRAWGESAAASSFEAWLAREAHPVRTVDAQDEDYGDLAAIGRAVAHARVVQLGEPSHGAGTCFAAKVRLVKFLHQVMGFDVLAWESGFYDLQRTEAGLRGSGDAVASAQRGILNIWSGSEQCRPLFEYAKRTHSGNRPLVMAGFDMQFTSNAFPEFAQELRTYVGGVRDARVRDQALRGAADAIEGFGPFNNYVEALAARTSSKPPQPGRDDLLCLQAAGDRLATLFDLDKQHFTAIGGERRRGFMAHAVANLAAYGANLYEELGAGVTPARDAELVRENRRDAQNARNLRWLVEQGYRGRKVIVWAHNVHVMRAYYGSDWKSVSLDATSNSMKPTGVYLAEWLGKSLYIIGCTAFEGQDGWVGGKPTSIAPAPADSVEAALHRLGYAFCYVDLRAARSAVGGPLSRPLRLRIPKYDVAEVADITRPYDGLLFIDRMTPATQIK